MEQPERTEFRWTYEPADLFEAPYEDAADGWRMSIGEGRVVLTVEGGRPPERLEKELFTRVQTLLQVRSLQTRRKFKLEEPASLIEFGGKSQNVVIRKALTATLFIGERLDVRIADATTGAVIRDSRAERIENELAEMKALVKKSINSPTLRAMLGSRARAVEDSGNELTHLYEIRDALAKHFGSDDETVKELEINSSDWSRLGRIANFEPILEGRHRGKHHENLRHATREELETVRGLAEDWIRRFASTLS